MGLRGNRQTMANIEISGKTMANIEISGKIGGDIYPFESGLSKGSFVVEIVARDLPVLQGKVDDTIIGKFRVQLRDAQGKLVKTLHWRHPQLRHRVFNTAAGPGTWKDGLILSDGPDGIVLLFTKPFPEIGAVIPTDLGRLRTGLETSLVYLGNGSRELSVTEGSARRVGD